MGITILYPTGEKERDIGLNASLSLDIISVHGLNGHSINTWTEPKSRKLWLRDFLPGDIPRARIMTFGYNATPAFENSMADIEDHARDLLRCLRECRESDTEIKRPLLFIGHSLGGLVIKQALVSSPNSSAYTPIYQSTIGTIFFGTPHRGSSLATYGALFARIPTALALKPSPQLLTALSQGSAALDELTDKYKELMDERPYKVVTFYETKAMTGLRNLIVTKESAVLSSPSKICLWETQVPVPAHHRDMCRFSSCNNPTYKTAVQSIQMIRQGGTSVQVKNEYYAVPYAVNSHFTGRDDIRRRLTDILLPTIDSGGREQLRFVLYGLGGSGKTQICLKFAQDYKDRFWGIFWIDASSMQTAEASFLSIARSCNTRLDMENAKDFLSTKEHWLLIIDNADDLDIDISKFFPFGAKGTILITTRNPSFEKHATVGSYHVDRMEKRDALALLLKTSALENIEDNQEKENERVTAAEKVVETLGCLALAIIQAGAVICQRMVTLNGFCELYSKHKKELLESGRPNSSIEDKRSVYTTWEISIGMIKKIEEEHAAVALELLRLFAFMHFTGINQSIFEISCNQKKLAAEHVDTSGWDETPLSSIMSAGWNQLLMGKAVSLLASFSLVTVDDDGRISMHPLVHQWSRDRMPAVERDSAWVTAVSTLSMAGGWRQTALSIQTRKMLLPHIDASLSEGEDQLFVDGPTIYRRLEAAITFEKAYRENFVPGAMNLTQKALTCIERVCLIADIWHTTVLQDLALDLAAIGKRKEAAEIRERLLSQLRENHASPEIIVANAWGCANAYIAVFEYQKAIELCENTLAEFSDTLGETNLEMICTMEVKGKTRWRMNDPEEARKDLEKALSLRKNMFGDGEGSVALGASATLAYVYKALKQHEKARMMYELHVKTTKEYFGAYSLNTVKAVARGEFFFYDSNSPYSLWRGAKSRAKRVASAEEAIRICLDHKGDVDVYVLKLMGELALDYIACGWFEKGVSLLEEVISRRREQFGEDDPATIEAMKNLRRYRRWADFRNVLYWWVPESMHIDRGLSLEPRKPRIYPWTKLGSRTVKKLSRKHDERLKIVP